MLFLIYNVCSVEISSNFETKIKVKALRGYNIIGGLYAAKLLIIPYHE